MSPEEFYADLTSKLTSKQISDKQAQQLLDVYHQQYEQAQLYNARLIPTGLGSMGTYGTQLKEMEQQKKRNDRAYALSQWLRDKIGPVAWQYVMYVAGSAFVTKKIGALPNTKYSTYMGDEQSSTLVCLMHVPSGAHVNPVLVLSVPQQWMEEWIAEDVTETLTAP